MYIFFVAIKYFFLLTSKTILGDPMLLRCFKQFFIFAFTLCIKLKFLKLSGLLFTTLYETSMIDINVQVQIPFLHWHQYNRVPSISVWHNCDFVKLVNPCYPLPGHTLITFIPPLPWKCNYDLIKPDIICTWV